MAEEKFLLKSPFAPSGDQPKAIRSLVESIKKGNRDQTLLGVTGSGKTFTVANVISKLNLPTLVIAHNKTLAAQLTQEYREFFPNNAVSYFVSYYDYYQPEAYVPTTDTYIEKDAKINQEIDRLRHATTQALLTRRDVIVVASVSCIYGLGNPEEYEKSNLSVKVGEKTDRRDFVRRLINVYFERVSGDLRSGTFRAVGNAIEVMPSSEEVIYRVSLETDGISEIVVLDAITRQVLEKLKTLFIFPAKHFVSSKEERVLVVKEIKKELVESIKALQKAGMNLEAERLKRRTQNDISLILEVGYCSGIENYSRFFDRRKKGEPPFTLLSYFPKKKDGTPDFLTVIDESHVTTPQIAGMYAGDRSRKKTLVKYGFRLPSACDNRPLKFDEFRERVGQIVYTSATPAEYELEKSKKNVIEQIIRPTGLVDPEISVNPVTESGKYKGQVQHFIKEAKGVIKKKGRVLATVLTKKMAEDLSSYLTEQGVKTKYLHSDIKTIQRIEILTEFRKGEFDVLVGVNLLREGLDLPEVELVGIFDADKEGFLRSTTSLIQTIGRAARNVSSRVLLYADKETAALKNAITETNRRRKIQIAYNKKHNITPKTVRKEIKDITSQISTRHKKTVKSLLVFDREKYDKNPKKFLKDKKKSMEEAVKILDFETAAIIRDEIRELKGDKK
ncbi:MAG: excinuclease ABC subunit UvrB [Candidatus Campbellbacteria bacterium]|nr:excinuclease ABC subunit UvrB [Candidatus Campbellbacteria bacterium]